MENKTHLFLDDIRYPIDAYFYTGYKPFIEEKWIVVRDYKQFVEHITTNGLPKFISFDHDLSYDQYVPVELWNDISKAKEWMENQSFTEKNGYDCAKWLVNYCLDSGLMCPDFFCHSMNPIGKNNIISLLTSFKNS